MNKGEENKTTKKVAKKKKKGSGRGWRIFGTIFLICLITGAMLSCMAAMYIKLVIMPESELLLTDYSTSLTTTVYYENPETGVQEVAQQLHGTENRVWVEYEDIPQYLIDATVAIEDKRFYTHSGVDWIRTVNGVICMFTGQSIQGGSTITQQLIKNVTEEDDVTVKRKIEEIFRALEFEKNYDKEEILEWYLNYIFLGEGCNGVYTASYTYFGKNVSDLSLAECASLISITNNPSLYNPYINAEGNKNRQELVLWNMLDQEKITQEEYDAAVAEELQFVRGEEETSTTTVYSWYVDRVITEVTEDLMSTYAISQQAAEAMVFSGGLQIYTCMDPDVQAAVEQIYGNDNTLTAVSSTGQSLQSAITIVDNETGYVVGIAGGVGEKTGSRSWSRATDSLRPPGSSIKPLAVYAPAIEMGLITPLTVEDDSPYTDSWPVNSYGTYNGPMTMIEALRVSANTVAVKVLANYVTPAESFLYMRDNFHIQLVESRTVGDTVYSDIDLAPLALGGLTDGVSTYDMAAAYSVFPRGGIYYEPTTYTKVLDSSGEVLLEVVPSGEVALKEKTCYYITKMLENVAIYGTGSGSSWGGTAVAGKTGTTTSRKDLWFVGYTSYYTAAVWTGYDQQEAVASSLNNPSVSLFKQVMQLVHEDLPYASFSTPVANLTSVAYCTVTGHLAGDYCEDCVAYTTLYAEDVPTEVCTFHTAPEPVGPFDPSDPLTYPTDDPNFNIDDPTTWPVVEDSELDALLDEAEGTLGDTTDTSTEDVEESTGEAVPLT